MQKLVLFPIASTLVGIGLIATALSGEAPKVPSAAGNGQRNYDVTSFDKVSAAGPMHVLVTVGPATSVEAEGPNATLDKYEVVVEHGSLEIRPKRHDFWGTGWRDLQPATFRVTLPQLSASSIAGSGDMKVDRVKGDEFSVSVAGSGKFEIDSLAVNQANFSVAGSGDLTARGRAAKSNVSIAGSGNMHLREFDSDGAAISVVGSGDAALAVRDKADVSIVGSGDVDVAGSANCTVSRFGGGHVSCNGRMENDEG
jgi:hypothetical protein